MASNVKVAPRQLIITADDCGLSEGINNTIKTYTTPAS